MEEEHLLNGGGELDVASDTEDMLEVNVYMYVLLEYVVSPCRKNEKKLQC